MPKFQVVSEYRPSGEPRESCAFAGTPRLELTGQAEPARSKVLPHGKALERRTGGGGPLARGWPPEA